MALISAPASPLQAWAASAWGKVRIKPLAAGAGKFGKIHWANAV